MANQDTGIFISEEPEDSIYDRPPFFDGTDYYIWKKRMRIFIEALDIDMWDAVENGPYVPSIATKAGTSEAKPRIDWTDDEKQKYQLNDKAKWCLVCALSISEYDRIVGCTTAKEMWDTLMIAHEGTPEVKKFKINNLKQEYDLFKMQKHESIEEMFIRLTIIVNKLRSLGTIYSNQEQVQKILRSLRKVWRPKVIAIQEAKDTSTLGLYELLDSLKDYEQELLAKDIPSRRGKAIALKAVTKGGKSSHLALNSIAELETEDEESASEYDDELDYICKKILKMWRRRSNR